MQDSPCDSSRCEMVQLSSARSNHAFELKLGKLLTTAAQENSAQPVNNRFNEKRDERTLLLTYLPWEIGPPRLKELWHKTQPKSSYGEKKNENTEKLRQFANSSWVDEHQNFKESSPNPGQHPSVFPAFLHALSTCHPIRKPVAAQPFPRPTALGEAAPAFPAFSCTGALGKSGDTWQSRVYRNTSPSLAAYKWLPQWSVF